MLTARLMITLSNLNPAELSSSGPWCFSPTTGRRRSSALNTAWSAPASPQPPLAANQALVGAVTKMIGAIHGRGSFTLASILELPAMLALKLPVLTFSTWRCSRCQLPGSSR